MCFFLPDHNNVLPGYKSPPEKQKKNYIYIYVAVNFSSQLIFLLLLSMVMYANEIETKEK